MNYRRTGGWFYLILIGVIVCVVLFSNRMMNSSGDRYNITMFEKDIEKGKVKDVDIYPDSGSSSGEIVASVDGDSVTFYVSDVSEAEKIVRDDKNLSEIYDVHRAQGGAGSQSLWMMVISSVAGIIIIFILVTVLQGRANSGGTSIKMADFGKSRARRIDPGSPDAKKFDDVAGLKEEKEELSEIVDFLKNPDNFTRTGARIPKGVILVGPPGTGKTLLAKAVAGEAGVPFFSLSGSDFVEMFVGVGASRVRDMFAEAKKNAPCIIFIDEIDAVARRRGTGLGGGHDEREQTLNQMLVEMDGFSVNQGIIVMAATNRVDILDPAILRPGRFDRKVAVGRPDVNEREEILKVHCRNKPLDETVDLKEIARTTVGFTGADLENLMNEAALLCARQGRSHITSEDVSSSFIKVGIGTEKKSHVVSEHDKRITAYHESGHAILFHVLPDVGPVHMVSIIPTGQGAGGYTMPIDESDSMYLTRGKMLQEIQVDLGGRIAESLIFDDVTTGASQDIKQATETARNMVTKYGFSSKIGLINYADEDEVFIGRDYGHTSKAYSEETARDIDQEVKNIIDTCYKNAEKIIKDHMDILHRSADLLMEKERITREEFEALFDGE